MLNPINSRSLALSLSRVCISGPPVYVGELRHWSHGDYTLLHDSVKREFALDLLLHLGCTGNFCLTLYLYLSYPCITPVSLVSDTCPALTPVLQLTAVSLLTPTVNLSHSFITPVRHLSSACVFIHFTVPPFSQAQK